MSEITDYTHLLTIALKHYAKSHLLVEAIDQRRSSAEIYNLALECVELASAIAKSNLPKVLKPPDEPT